MKKKAIIIIVILAAISIAVSLAACSVKAKRSGETEQSSLSEKEHFSPIENTDTVSSESESEESTEAPKDTTEAVTDRESETETEPIIEFIPESLRYTSYNNGTCGVTGIGSCTDLFVVIPERSPSGDIVTAIEERAFYGNSSIKAVEIPSTVSTVGSMAFGNCSALVYISVDKNNKSFTDIGGILYSYDKSTLISFPSNCGSQEVLLQKSVTKISDMAFYNCNSLKSIIYEGTLSDWSRIQIGDLNYGLFTASVTCQGGK